MWIIDIILIPSSLCICIIFSLYAIVLSCSENNNTLVRHEAKRRKLLKSISKEAIIGYDDII